MDTQAERVGQRGCVGGGVGLMLLMLGLGSGPLTAQEAPSFPDLPADLPVGEGSTRPCLSSVEGEVLCGRFRVAENRDVAGGRTIDIAFVVLKALRDGGNADAFTQFYGGPGAGTTASASAVARGRADIRADRDILLVDYRGVGSSSPLSCDNPYPGGTSSRFETIFPLDHVDACRERLSARADLSRYTTPGAMDDLAELTEWLGYAQLDLFGGSYGTREAQVFTRRHPEMVRTVVLNGVAPVQDRVYLYHARYLQDALENLFDECEAQSACREAFPDLREATREVLETAKSAPATVQAEGTAVPFGIGPLSYALRGLLYGQAGTVPARIYEARNGHWQGLADYFLSRQAWVRSADGTPAGYHFSVLCAEDIDPLTWPEIEQATAGTFMGDYLIGGYKRACEHWSAAEPPPSFFQPVRSDKPTLILSGGRDPVTPVAGGEEIAAGWPNSLHVVVPNGGHGQGGPCIDRMVLHLVRTGTIDGIDTSCVQSRPPTRFEIP